MLKVIHKFNERGFTLIELLIVVAIIAILAAIAIPQFAAYRIRGFNASANSDVRNLATTQEALFADTQAYGFASGAALATAACAAGGVVITGPQNPATPTAAGANIRNNLGSVGFSVSNRVRIGTNVDANCITYVIAAKHDNGDACFFRDADSTASYRGVSATNYVLAAADIVAATTPSLDIAGWAGCSNLIAQ